ncbi:YsnF/AvaK domain-containing protein [Mixta calida]|uniref:YsnF/AvaK domain-containing protein n=1 Tax=Mixta calida TaxID=665913 RepID=UPI00291017B3|nr:YsnF/AvaK domain-containing protein [Mixta calida]MDU6536802.1 YsnF/AvaK domain-containing protein [Mixta calida]
MAHEKIVTAFNQIQQAEVAKEKLIAEGIAENHIDIISGERLRVEGKEIRHPSFWQRLFGDDVDDDYATEYNKAIQGGGVLLTVRARKEDADRIETLLDQYSTDYTASYNRGASTTDREFLGETDDVSGRTTSAGFNAGAKGVTGDTDPTAGVPGTLDHDSGKSTAGKTGATDLLTGKDSTTGVTGASTTGVTGASTTGVTGTTAAGVTGAALTGSENHEALKLAEEQVDIGKRQVSDGVVRLRRYTVEDEVAEDVSLFEQHADVFRTAVDEPAYLSDVDWSEKTIEVEESHEVPTVSKTARIKEEVGVRNETSERVETVKDTVRRQEVEVEQTGGTGLEKDRLTGVGSTTGTTAGTTGTTTGATGTTAGATGTTTGATGTTTGVTGATGVTGTTTTGFEKDSLTGSDLDKDPLTGVKK